MKTHREILNKLMNERYSLSAAQFERAIRLASRVAKDEGTTAKAVFAQYGWHFA